MLIRQVEIENFKRLEHCKIDLRAFTCLVGPNNSGKTTLLQALAFFDFCIHLCISGRNGGVELKKRNISPEEFYVLPVASPVDLWTNRTTQARKKHKIIRITVTFDNGRKATAALDLNFNVYHFSVHTEDASDEWLKSLSGFRMAYLPVFSSFLPQEERRTPAVIEDALVRGSVNSVIRNLLLDLKDKGRVKDLEGILQRAFPSLRDMRVAFDESVDRYIGVTYKERERAKEFDVFSSGSGFQQFVYLFGFISLRQPSTILLDEPDVHLHGTLQNALLGELRQIVQQGKQVLFATHSRDLISRLSPDEILSLDEDPPRRLSIKQEIYDTLDKLGSLDPAELSKIQAYRLVLVVENRTDRDLVFLFGRCILGPRVWTEVERHLAVCYAQGNPLRGNMPTLRKQLHDLLGLQSQPLKMFVVADRDYCPDIKKLRDRLPKQHIRWHVWERTEVENYLLCIPAIMRAVGAAGMSLWEQPLKDELDRLVEESRNSANDRLVKAFQEYHREADRKPDASALSREAREYLQAHWESERLMLADAKEIVLPGIKRWLRESGLGQFSDVRVAEELEPGDLPEEVHVLTKELAEFAGVDPLGQ